MVLSKQQMEELETLAKPLVEWINDSNLYPYGEIRITGTSIEFLKVYVGIPLPQNTGGDFGKPDTCRHNKHDCRRDCGVGEHSFCSPGPQSPHLRG